MGYIDAFTLSLNRGLATGEEVECCSNSTGSSIASCSGIVELHSYQITINTAIFHGPLASLHQITYLMYYAWGHVDLEDSDGGVDLRMSNVEAMDMQAAEDKNIWKRTIKDKKRRGKTDKIKKAARSLRGQ